MWQVYALLAAVFAALTAIFSKLGVRDVDSGLATAIRVGFILLLTWGMSLYAGTWRAVVCRPPPSFSYVPRAASGPHGGGGGAPLVSSPEYRVVYGRGRSFQNESDC